MKSLFTLQLFLLFSVSVYSQNQDWVYRNPLPQNDFYAIKFFDQNTGYVVGSNGIILKNTTGSNNWINVPSGTTNNLYGMYFFDVNHGYVVGEGELIMYTSNGGNSWISFVVPNGYAFRSVSFVNSNTGFAAGDNGSLYKTTSGITGFAPINVTTVNLRSVFAVDSLRIYASGDSGKFFRTTNGGSNWTVQTIGDGSLTCVYFMNSQTGYLTATTPSFGSNTNAYMTTDAGATWNMIQFFRIQNNWGTVRFANQNTGFIAGNNNLLMHTTNGGLNWMEQGVPQRTFLNDISVVDTLAFICGNNGWIYETTVSGYTKCLGGTKQDFASMTFLNENIGIIVTDFDYLRTVNGGTKWNLDFFGGYAWEEGCAGIQTDVRSFPPLSVYRVTEAVSCHGGPSFYDLDNSTDGGITWIGNRSFYQTNVGIPGVCEIEGVTYISARLPNSTILKNNGSGWVQIYSANFYIGSLSFSNQNTGAVIGGGSVPGILRTSNGGTNWSFISASNNRSENDIKLFPSGIGYLACDSSFILRTTDFGITWVLLPNNINSSFRSMQFVNDNTGWVISYGGNFWYSTKLYFTNNGGNNFYQVQSLGNFNPRAMSFINALTGYVSGDSGVVLKTTNGGLTFVNANNNSVPNSFSLSQNYPNPFNPVTKIKFNLPNPSEGGAMSTRLIIYDVLGREVVTLLNKQLHPGSYSVDWDGTNYPSGVYFYKLEVRQTGSSTGDYAQTKKMVLIK
jgi:photosystem II stability/assembly factor-like uncharacterized protein